MLMETKWVMQRNIADPGGCKGIVGKQLSVEHRLFRIVSD